MKIMMGMGPHLTPFTGCYWSQEYTNLARRQPRNRQAASRDMRLMHVLLVIACDVSMIHEGGHCGAVIRLSCRRENEIRGVWVFGLCGLT